MVKKAPQVAIDELPKIAAAHPEGVSAPDVAKDLVVDVPCRTLQYQLKQLVGTGQLNMQGSGRWLSDLSSLNVGLTLSPIALALGGVLAFTLPRAKAL